MLAIGVVALGVLAGCGGDDAPDAVDASDGKVKVHDNGDGLTIEDGESSLSVGDPELPKRFPSDDVPLPEDSTLKAAVSGKNEGKQYFSLTYAVKGGIRGAAKEYKQQLRDEDFTIKASSAVGGSAASFTAFTAVSPDWDVVVYSGGDTSAGGLSLQVTTHDELLNGS